MSVAYFDSTYLAKLHWREHGSDQVILLASNFHMLACSYHGRSELASVGHRKVREKAADTLQANSVFEQMEADTSKGGIVWHPLTLAIFSRVEYFYLRDRGTVPLRAADALHLACAVENGYTEVYSNDRNFLAAAPLFGLQGINVIPPN